jgi:hypothetical protein
MGVEAVALVVTSILGFVWRSMKRRPYLVAGLRLAGFAGGWLAATT